MTNADLTLWVEQKKEELIKGYRSPLIKYRVKEDGKMKVKKGSTVTVVDNETGKETTGRILEYTPDSIVIEKIIKFDAKKVHFKELSSQQNKKLMDALEEFIETNSGIYDLNDTAEFIYYERDGLLKLLKEWDESK